MARPRGAPKPTAAGKSAVAQMGPIIESTVPPVEYVYEPIPESETADYIDQKKIKLVEGVPTETEVVRLWKRGSAEYNRQALVDLARAASDYFRDRYQVWDTLTQAQKDAAVKQGMRALANLCALAANKLDDPGV
jgi:hypothetical protein